MQKRKKEADALLGHVLDSKTPVAVKATGSSRNPRGSGERRPSIKRRPEKRSPVHKRVKIPVRTEAEQIQQEFEQFSKAMERNIKEKMAQMHPAFDQRVMNWCEKEQLKIHDKG